MKTALYYIYGLPEDYLNSISTPNIEEANLFRNPDECSCGGMIKWERCKLMSLKIKGVCERCGKETIKSEK